jgi:hypothetical protein
MARLHWTARKTGAAGRASGSAQAATGSLPASVSGIPVGQAARATPWKRPLTVHLVSLLLCVSILLVMVVEKFAEGGWITLLITAACAAICLAIRGHYRAVARRIRRIDQAFTNLRLEPIPPAITETPQLTGVVLVGSYGGLGVHSVLSVMRLFPRAFRQLVFVSVGVIESGIFKGAQHVTELEQQTRDMLRKYEETFGKLGIPTSSACSVGADIVSEVTQLCLDQAKEHGPVVVIAGELVFDEPTWYHRLLHNQTAYAIQGRLRYAGLPMLIQPIRLAVHDVPKKKPRRGG